MNISPSHGAGVRHKDRDALPRCVRLIPNVYTREFGLPFSLMERNWHCWVLFISSQCSCLKQIWWLTLWAQLSSPLSWKGARRSRAAFAQQCLKLGEKNPGRRRFPSKAPEKGCFESSQESLHPDWWGVSWALNPAEGGPSSHCHNQAAGLRCGLRGQAFTSSISSGWF